MAKTKFSILQNIQEIVELLQQEGRESSAYNPNKALDKLTIALGVTMNRSKLSALHFAAAFHLAVDEDTFTIRDISKLLKIKLSDYGILLDELDKLVEEGLLERSEGYGNKREYGITNETRQAIFHDLAPKPIELTTDIFGFCDFARTVIEKIEKSSSYYDQGLKLIEKAIEKNPDLPLCNWLRENKMSGPELLMAMLVFVRSMHGFGEHNLRELLDASTRSQRERIRYQKAFMKDDTLLIRKGLLKWGGEDIKSHEYIVLTDAGKDICLGEEAALILEETTIAPVKNLIAPEDIRPKNLHYNEREKQEMSRIEAMIMPARYDEVCRNFASRNMPAGICIMLYGGPGTGKTESVLQIAKKTGRAICHIDISTIKDMWAGQSEKNVKAIFDKYRAACKNMTVKPILLLNEADALINKRINVERSIDQMVNAMQNIFLEEMEKFEGILIATTNLQNNFDPAFDRRFLFKVRFEKPSIEIRAKILKDRIPSLQMEDAQYLAAHYELTGGQVENVARKIVTELLLSGQDPDRKTIEKFCNEESTFRGVEARNGMIGFNR